MLCLNLFDLSIFSYVMRRSICCMNIYDVCSSACWYFVFLLVVRIVYSENFLIRASCFGVCRCKMVKQSQWDLPYRCHQMLNSLLVLCLSHIDRPVLPHSRRFWGEGLVWLDVGRFFFLQWRRWRRWWWWWWRSEAKDENHQGSAASSSQGRRLRLSRRPCCSCSKIAASNADATSDELLPHYVAEYLRCCVRRGSCE